MADASLLPPRDGGDKELLADLDELATCIAHSASSSRFSLSRLPHKRRRASNAIDVRAPTRAGGVQGLLN